MGNWALLVVDSAAIRQKAKAEYEQVLKQVNDARHELERFEMEDRPKFSRWLNSQFGSLLTELRETHQRLSEQRERLMAIEFESFLTGVSAAEAYRQQKAREENPDLAKEFEAEFSDIFEDDDDSGDAPPLEDDPFGPDRHSHTHQKTRRGSKSNRKAGPPKPPDRVKELYRMLVRRLHPDLHPDLTRQMLEWWHQVQVAYQKGDAEQLEVILSLYEMTEKGSAAETSVSLLKRITQQFRSSLRALRQQLGKHRNEPAWNFSRLTDLKPLAQRIQRELESELRGMKTLLRRIESQLADIAEAAQRLRTRRRRRRPAAFDELDPF